MTSIKPRSKKAAIVKETAASKKTTKMQVNETPIKVEPDQRIEMIRKAAYLKAEQRGFAGGSPEQDWLDAETEVDEFISN